MEEEKQRHYFSARLGEFVDRIRGEIENWSERRSGRDVDKITIAYVNVACYQLERGGVTFPFARNWETKKQ